MNFSEFKLKLGAEPRSDDPEFLQARDSSPEFAQAADEAIAFEQRLERAVDIPVPEQLIADLKSIGVPSTPAEQSERKPARRFVPLAMAASLLVAVGAAGLVWKNMNSWDSVEEYLADHYQHDGMKRIAEANGSAAPDAQAFLAEVGAQALPQLAEIIDVIKYCPTPDGKGVHMVLNTQRGPVTLIYMPDTAVSGPESLHFDDVDAVLVSLPRGSAALLGAGIEQEPELLALVQTSLVRKG